MGAPMFMSFFSPFRPLLRGWGLSFFGWGLVGFAMATYGVTTRGDPWTAHGWRGLQDWLPWAVFTPLIFRLVARLPFDRSHWRLAAPVHLACCALVIAAGHWWKAAPFLDPRDAVGRPPGAPDRRGPGGPPPGERFGPPGERFAPPGERAGPPGAVRGQRPPPPRGDGFRGPPEFAPRMLGPGRGGPPGGPRGGFDPFRFFSFQLPIYLMLLTGAHAALFFRRDQERAASLARARLEALRMQLQPHFLFNTLNTIAGLVHEEPDKADAMLTSLSELLRMSLATSSEPEMPLGRELDFVERYLDLMHARYEERLLFTIDAEPDARAALVPPMLLQPIVENAVEHGIQPKPGGGRVTVRAWRDGDTLRLAVRDDGVGLPPGAPPPDGIGLGNTRARLRELYGDRASLTLQTRDGTEAAIALPFRLGPEAATAST